MRDGPEPELTSFECRALAARWSTYLQHDRRRSAHTVRAYVATAHRLVDFLERFAVPKTAGLRVALDRDPVALL